MATMADLLTKTLADAGVERIWGVTGDSLNGLSDSLRRLGRIAWMHVRHEETAAFAAGAEAALTGRLAACAGSCGPGNFHLINGLFDCTRRRLELKQGRRDRMLVGNRLAATLVLSVCRKDSQEPKTGSS